MSWSIQSSGLASEVLAAADKAILQQTPHISDIVEQEHAREVLSLLTKVLCSIPQGNVVNVSASGHVSSGLYTLKVSVEPRTEQAAPVVQPITKAAVTK